jgi:hypothetical protein
MGFWSNARAAPIGFTGSGLSDGEVVPTQSSAPTSLSGVARPGFGLLAPFSFAGPDPFWGSDGGDDLLGDDTGIGAPGPRNAVTFVFGAGGFTLDSVDDDLEVRYGAPEGEGLLDDPQLDGNPLTAPEPASMWLLGGGLAVAARALKRHRDRSSPGRR